HIPISNVLFIPYLGLILIILGMILRFISVWSLGRLFTVDITIRDNHKIKKDGVYRIIRHPSYSGSLLSFIGFGISLNNWISLIIISILLTIAMLYRIKIEERLLIDQFGFKYLDYTKRTYRLIPWIY
ncbi:MAG TPA: isoprenylcysteine carboxylmethyltransferase family protein, partial [Bacteroidales bacterium]|nr:isoprenylcysteine carboxylmethyltransferase family protein [Bacteroidales bacterium]